MVDHFEKDSLNQIAGQIQGSNFNIKV